MHPTLFNKKFNFSLLKDLHLGDRITKISGHWLPAGFSHNGFNALNTELDHLSKSISNACIDVEPEFMEIGEQLQHIYQKTALLSSQVMDSVKRIDGRSKGGLLEQMRQMAEKALCELNSCRKEVQIKTTQRKSVVDHLSTLLKIFSEIEKIGMLLKIVGVNINIESSRSEKSSELFAVVAVETTKLSEKIRLIAEESMNILHAALTMQQTLFNNISKGAAEIDHLGASAQKITNAAIADIETLMASSLIAAEKAAAHSDKINRKVGDLVVSIQFHDSMSQRLDHIIKAFCDAVKLFSGADIQTSANGKNERIAQGFSIIALQNTQLKQIISDIEHVHRESLTAFETIFSEIDSLSNLLSNLKQNNRLTVHKESKTVDPFIRLKKSFEELAQVLGKSQELINPERQAANRVSETVGQITKVVSDIHSIGFETHLMAINAIIKAAHLGQDGGALEILAHEVNKSSDQSMAILKQTDTLLTQITDAAKKLQHETAEDTAEISIMKSVSGISEAYESFIRDSSSAGHEAGEIKETISTLKTRLYFLPSLAECLSELLFKSETIVSQYSPSKIEKFNIDSATMDNLLDRYTMARERKIHANALANPRDSVFALPENPPLGAELLDINSSEENLGENVELF